MAEIFFIGVDIGTSESKGVLVDGKARIVAYHACPHRMSSPRPGYAEHDALSVWWHDLCALTRALIEKSGVDPNRLGALGISTIAPCCLPVDKELNPLTPAMLYGVDVRAHKEIDYLNDFYGMDAIIRRCGSPVTAQSAAAKILWLKNNQPDVYKKARYFLTGSSFLVAKLTGNVVIDHYTAAPFVPAYDIEKAGWAKDWLEPICEPDRLARCALTCAVAGKVTEAAAKETGLPAGLPVTVGTADAAAEAVSGGVIGAGDLLLMLGSSVFMIHVTDRLYPDKRIWTGPYLFEGSYCASAGVSTTGTLTRWFKENFARELIAAEGAGGQNAYEALAREAAETPAGAGGLTLLPHLSGERTPMNDPLAQGLIFGLNLTHTRAHLYRAALEGVGYAVGQHIDIFRERGMGTKRAVSVGGGTQNGLWLQILSDISGIKQLVPEVAIGASLGDAMLSAYGVGFYKTPEEMTAGVRIAKTVSPDPELTKFYAPSRRRYADLYRLTKELMHERI